MCTTANGQSLRTTSPRAGLLEIDARRVGHFTVSIIFLYLFDIWTINTISVRWHSSVTFIELRSESVFPLYFLLGYLHSHVVYLTRTLSSILITVDRRPIGQRLPQRYQAGLLSSQFLDPPTKEFKKQLWSTGFDGVTGRTAVQASPCVLPI